MMKKYLFSFILLSVVVAVSDEAIAQQKQLYTLSKNISLPGDAGYDYLFIDQQSRKLFVSHGTSVHVLDLDSQELIATVEGMQGNHGIAVANDAGLAFVSDGKANAVIAVDLKTMKAVRVIPLTGKKPDAIIYDPFSKYVFAFNGSSDNISVVDVKQLKEIDTIPLAGAPEFAVADGKGKIYNNIEDKNLMAVIDSKNLKVINSYPLAPCGGPTGLAMDSIHKRLFTACRENKGLSIVDMNSGKVITTVPIGSGVDAVVYDADTKLVICSNGDGTATIIKQQSPDEYKVVQTLATQYRAKTMALDTKTHNIYFSVADFDASKKSIIPGTFKVLVYKMSSL